MTRFKKSVDKQNYEIRKPKKKVTMTVTTTTISIIFNNNKKYCGICKLVSSQSVNKFQLIFCCCNGSSFR